MPLTQQLFRNRIEATDTKMFNHILRNEEEYQGALDRVEAIFDAVAGTPEGDEAELLTLLLKDYEDRHYPIPLPDPIEVLKITMADQGLKPKDLVGVVGSKGYVSQLLNKKKPLTVEVMRILHKQFGVPAESLLA